MSKVARPPWWALTWPALAFAIMIVTIIFGAAGATAAVAGAILIAAVFAAVYHAEVVAHRIGEPFGTLVLALAVTIIEVALIVSVMLGVSADKAGLARDTVFSVVMIVCNGIVGLCLLLGGVRHHEQGFQVQGASAALAVLAPLTILTMVDTQFHEHARSCLQHVAACVCCGRLPCALRLIHFRADDASPRLLLTSRQWRC